ncbi:MAG: polyprenyl synthetase family protein [Defluviitaleaceae bacterium]|nr:polyprenyl synthetase family protein [Defluviitaleaceae bacterium]
MMNNNIDYKALIDSYLDKILDEKAFPEIIYKAMGYSVKKAGKRLRPLLMLYTAEGFDGDIDKIMPFAAAIECIHSYSLIHDDLPCIDNDDIRRGKPTNHKVFGEGMALLAGDGLLNLAYEFMSGACVKNFSKESVLAMNIIAKSAGTNGMIGGQVVDIISEDKIVDGSTLLYIQKNKTGAIIKSAVAAGAVLCGANDEQIAKLTEAAEAFGIAFQIKDDILDIKGSVEILGKPIGSDAANKKLTHVSLYGLEKAEADYLEYSDKAMEIVKGLKLKTASLENYMGRLINREF